MRSAPVEVFGVALRLGLTAFGGPIAHLGYFEREYVERRRWLSAEDFAGLVGLCQVLPGPASSQVGFLIGLRRAGWSGALAAWLGFTLPSALLMASFAWIAPRLSGPIAHAGLHGLKLAAVVIVAQAVLSMARKLCPDRVRAAIALTAAAVLLFGAGPFATLLVLGLGAVAGAGLCRADDVVVSGPLFAVSPRAAWIAAGVFLLLLVGLPVAAIGRPHGLTALAAILYRSGTLVFGGGHVAAPLLRNALVPAGWLSDDAFLAGYGATQAVPGPLFTFSAYLGAVAAPAAAGPPVRALWSATALAAMFAPGLLLSVAGQRMWAWVAGRPVARRGLAGVNAAVVGVLGAALYDPIWISAVLKPRDVAVVLIGFVLLERWRAAPIVIVGGCVAAALALSRLP